MTSTPFHMRQALRWSRRALAASASGNKLAALTFIGHAFRESGLALHGRRPEHLSPRGFKSRMSRVDGLVDQAARRALL